VCHSIDEFGNAPFGDGRILTATERTAFNALTLFFVYPVAHVVLYLKILKPHKWWAIFFYTIVLIEHVLIMGLYYRDKAIVAAFMTALAFLSFSTHIFYNAFYTDADFFLKAEQLTTLDARLNNINATPQRVYFIR
jgi:hypothetical protein